MGEPFTPSRPDAHAPMHAQPSLNPNHFFPGAVSTPVSNTDWVSMENLHKVAVQRGRHNPPIRSASDRNLIHLENTDVEAGIDASGEDVQASQRHTFSIEQPGSRPETPQDVPLIKMEWGQKAPDSSDPHWQQEGAKGPSTPTHHTRSPAKGYPTPEPCYLEGRSPSLLAAAPKRRRCCLMRPLTLFLAGLLVLAAVLIGLAVGQFAVPLIRTMSAMGAPSPVLGAKPLEALPGQPGAAGSDSMDSVSGIGLEVDSSGVPDSAPVTQPARAWRNPYLDRNRQGQGTASTSSSSPPPGR